MSSELTIVSFRVILSTQKVRAMLSFRLEIYYYEMGICNYIIKGEPLNQYDTLP